MGQDAARIQTRAAVTATWPRRRAAPADLDRLEPVGAVGEHGEDRRLGRGRPRRRRRRRGRPLDVLGQRVQLGLATRAEALPQAAGSRSRGKTKSVRRIASCLTRRAVEVQRSVDVGDRRGVDARPAGQVDGGGSVACSTVIARVAASGEPTQTEGASACRSASRARRSASGIWRTVAILPHPTDNLPKSPQRIRRLWRILASTRPDCRARTTMSNPYDPNQESSPQRARPARRTALRHAQPGQGGCRLRRTGYHAVRRRSVRRGGASEPPKGTDAVSITGFVLSLTCCLSIIGAILGFVGLGAHEERPAEGSLGPGSPASPSVSRHPRAVVGGIIVGIFGPQHGHGQRAEAGQSNNVADDDDDIVFNEAECTENHDAQIVYAGDAGDTPRHRGPRRREVCVARRDQAALAESGAYDLER